MTRSQKGACATHLWIVMELAYICRLRGIEVVTLSDANSTADGVMTNRRKGSRDNVVRWYPRLTAAWNAAIERRAEIWSARGTPIPMHPESRPLYSGNRWRLATKVRTRHGLAAANEIGH
ncbi:hypothetical protein LZG37_24800 [Halomonas titanicae]|nr:hypothetical protein [Halomonas titanicae]MCE7521359.1 hypothetical protein [Halomonas titanicae]